MHLIPNSWGSEVALREFNPCHAQDSGKFCSVAERVGEAGAILRTGVAEVVNSAIEKGFHPDYELSTEEWHEQVLQRNVQKDLARDILDHAELPGLAAHFAGKSKYWKAPGETDAEAVARQLVTGWATSGLRGDLAVALQFAADDTFTLAASVPATVPEHDTGRALYDKFGGVFRTALKAQYDRTQRFFKDRGIEEVTLLRGAALPLPHSSPEIGFKPLESFTSDPAVAARFGAGSVVVARLPVSAILSIARTGFGTLSESEFVVLGGRRRVKVYARKDWSWPPKESN